MPRMLGEGGQCRHSPGNARRTPVCLPDRGDPAGSVSDVRPAKSWRRCGQSDPPFYDRHGGLTLTGGEVTMQPAFAAALLRLAQAEGIHTAMETAGHTQWPVLERVMRYVDLVLYDIKHMDSDVHRRYTEVGNELNPGKSAPGDSRRGAGAGTRARRPGLQRH